LFPLCLLSIPSLDSGFYNTDRTHYYDFNNNLLPWGDSIEAAHNYQFKCREGHLATVTSQDEMALILSNSGNNVYTFWIAGNHIEHNSKTLAQNDDTAANFWQWGDGPEKGQPVKWVDCDGVYADGWAAGEPNANAPQDAVVINGIVQGHGCMKLRGEGFHDESCSTELASLVEYECPEGFYFGEQCCEGNILALWHAKFTLFSMY
jgi:hypothetical protein